MTNGFHSVSVPRHLGTGNYNDTTARLYTDIGLLTARDAIGREATLFFNAVTGYWSAPRDALYFTEGMSYEEFAHDRRTQLSVLKSVEIVGEAAAHVSEENETAHPTIPWRDIVGMRNRLVHAYFDIDLPSVWSTVRDDLPGLTVRF